jgi:hypothetical protein
VTTPTPGSSDPAETMRAAAARLRDPYRCNSDPRADRTLADWLDAAARDAEEVGPDYRAERVAAAVLGVPAHPRVCPPGRHRPDDDPTPGDRCKDCGNTLTWRGPGPNDWDVVEPEPVADAEPDATRYWIGTCPTDGVHIGIKTEGSDPDVPLVMRARDSIDTTCLCGTALTLRLVTRAEYEDAVGPDDDDPEDDDDPDDVPLLEDTDGAPYPDHVQRAHRLAVRDARRTAAVHSLRAHARLLRRLADDDDGTGTSAAGLTDAAQETEERADAIEAGRLAP